MQDDDLDASGGRPTEPVEIPRLQWYRIRSQGRIAGVCAGLALYTGLPVEVFRVAFLIGAFFGWGIVIYVALALIMPAHPAPPPRRTSKGATRSEGNAGNAPPLS